MDYEATDRLMSSWHVSCLHNGTRFYLTDDGVASDIRSNAAVFRYLDRAEFAARKARMERSKSGAYSWIGFDWGAFSVAEAMAAKCRTPAAS